jgi:salicylate synthetase
MTKSLLGLNPGDADSKATTSTAPGSDAAHALHRPPHPWTWTRPGTEGATNRDVDRIIAAIHDRAPCKATISRRVDVPFAVDLPHSYAVELGHNTPARSFLPLLGQRRCAGFSPAILAEVNTTGQVATQTPGRDSASARYPGPRNHPGPPRCRGAAHRM